MFPHHENELARNRNARQEKLFAKYWLHNGPDPPITPQAARRPGEDGKTEARSLGNVIDAKTLIAEKQARGHGAAYLLLGDALPSTRSISPDQTMRQCEKGGTAGFRSLVRAHRPAGREAATTIPPISRRHLRRRCLLGPSKAISSVACLELKMKFLEMQWTTISTPPARSA